jgi:hypothetical protein
MGDWSDVEDDVILRRALRCARGDYQRALIYGDEATSGSTLKGKAREYSGRYKASVVGLMSRLERLDGILCYVEKRGQRHVLILRWQTEQDLVDLAERRMA